jgi:phosphoribosylamine--glycine ligase
VQDHKRAFVDDKGPNCGGMGSYSCEDHLLPFLTKKDVNEGLKMTQKVADAIHKDTGQFYKGVMYAGLIVTKNGVKLLEYNARFGDPEAMNVLPLMETDFVEVCNAIINQQLNKIKIRFKNKATVCKYIVPEGYPINPAKDQKIIIENVPQNAKIYYASVEQRVDGLYTTSSRAIACLGIADSLEKAEKIAEEATNSIKGRVFHRRDIGTKKLIEERVIHMKTIHLN